MLRSSSDAVTARDIDTRAQAVKMGVRTLRGISEGGIRDHVGGGVARYSVDERASCLLLLSHDHFS